MELLEHNVILCVRMTKSHDIEIDIWEPLPLLTQTAHQDSVSSSVVMVEYLGLTRITETH
jgi:hypothetical protein